LAEENKKPLEMNQESKSVFSSRSSNNEIRDDKKFKAEEKFGEIYFRNKINKIEEQIDNVTNGIGTIEEHLATNDFTNDKLNDNYLRDKKKDLRKEEKDLRSQVTLCIQRLPKGINIYKYFYFIIYVKSSSFLLLNCLYLFYNINDFFY
jgi:hypothetical protein